MPSLARTLNETILLLIASLLQLVSRVLGASFQRVLGATRRAAAVARWLLGLATPEGLAGTLQLGRIVAHRVRALLEHSATLAVAEEPLHRRLTGLPAPVSSYLHYALGELPPDTSFRLSHIQMVGHFRFLPGSVASSAGSGWHSLKAETYLSPQTPAYVWSASVQLGPLSWVRGFASYLQGAGSTQWKMCSPFRVRDLEQADQTGAAVLGQASLTAFLAEAPCCPTALLPSSSLRWRALTESSAEAVVSDNGAEASAVFHFNRAGQVVKMCSPAQGSATCRGAGSMAGSGPRSSIPTVWYYRQYKQCAGMLVPTELEAAWQLPSGGEFSFAHIDVEQVTAWESLEMLHAPPPHTA